MLLKGGVAGGVPPHKGGPKARPPKKTRREWRGVRKTWARLAQGCELTVVESLPKLYECSPPLGDAFVSLRPP